MSNTSRKGGPSRKQKVLTNILPESSPHIMFAKAMIDPTQYPSDAANAPSRTSAPFTTVCEPIVFSTQGRSNCSISVHARPFASVIERGIIGSGLLNGLQGSVLGHLTFTQTQVSHSRATASFVRSADGVFAMSELSSAGGFPAVTPDVLDTFQLGFENASGVQLNVSSESSAHTLKCEFLNSSGGLMAESNLYIPSRGSYSVQLTPSSTWVSMRFSGNQFSSVANVSDYVTICPLIVATPQTFQMLPNAHVYHLQTLAKVNQFRYYRIVAQTLLCTYTGSSVLDGGTSATAMVSSQWTQRETNAGPLEFYDGIVGLPAGIRYDGALKNGSHVFLLPNSVADFDPRQMDAFPYSESSNKLVAGWNIDNAEQSVRVAVMTVIQYNSEAVPYASHTISPPWEDFDLVLHALRMMNPASENKSHLQKIKKLMTIQGRKAIAYARDNPEKIAELLSFFV